MNILSAPSAQTVARLRGIVVAVGLFLTAHAHAIAEATGLPVELVSGLGILLTGGATGVAAGEKNIKS